ncbi:HEAT repeat domain-containing protein [Streptomyces sp. NPDC048717]|uniref:HEAT repeat domain-containing protein n=1 Tax=Streptomyces sp. NPDC048717 TaxID=3154928 RepID=UPI0034216611
MATFVHLTPADRVTRVRRNGIRAVGKGRGRGLGRARGVYLFPVLSSYTLTHQWLRELSRFHGSGELVAVHVKLPDGEPVTVGRYDARDPEETTAAGAVGRVAGLEDPRGWEVFLPRAVTRGEVRAVRAVRQVTGWRYWPGAHGTTPCTCQGCRIRGEYGSRRLRERRPHPFDGPPPAPRVLLGRIEAAEQAGDSAALCATLQWYGMRRRGPLARLARLAGHPDPTVRTALVEAVAYWSTPGVDALLAVLAGDPDGGVREAVGDAREEREERYGTAREDT